MVMTARFWVVTDLETSGIDAARHDILQIARTVIDISTQDYVPGSFISTYVKPVRWVGRDPEAMAVNKLSWDVLAKDGVSLAEAISMFEEGIDWEQAVVASWGYDFEKAFLDRAYRLLGRTASFGYKGIDIRSMAYLSLAAKGVLVYPGLKEAASLYGVVVGSDANWHDAGFDVEMASEVVFKLLQGKS
jgi:DNA polymerase III epsilon subunit-like protein